MTALDVFVFLLLIGGAAVGFVRGFVHEVISLFAWVVAIAMLKLFRTQLWTGIQSSFHASAAAGAVLAFAILFVPSFLIVKLLARQIGGKTRRHAMLGPFDRVLGGGFGGLKGLLGATLFFLLANLATDMVYGPEAARPEWMTKSRTYPLLNASGRAIVDWVEARRGHPREAEGVEPNMITERYERHYLEDMGALGVQPPDIAPHATQEIPQMVAMIQLLLELGHAYEAEGHVLFAVPSDPDYGSLSKRDREAMVAGARVEVAPYKRDPADFVLWKPSGEGVIGWDSPWGRGRPGWHVECSAMIETHLGETIDIHGGGLDLIFPHHENEIAQTRCAHAGLPLARFWVHNGF